jgi:hypothetical protein
MAPLALKLPGNDGVGENMGEGSQIITEVSGEKVAVDLNFISPMPGVAKASTSAKAKGDNQTEIVMTFESHSSYPFNLMSKLFGDGMIRDAQKKNLANLRGILETNH